MKYLCLVCFDEKDMDAFTPSEHERLTEESLAYDEHLQRRRKFLAAEALQPVATATRVRVRNGKVSATDGPFAETKEQIGGFILIEAENLDEAIDIASKIPIARLGTIEVRPIMDLA